MKFKTNKKTFKKSTWIILVALIFGAILLSCQKEVYDCAFFENLKKIDQEIRNDRRCNVYLYIADSLIIANNDTIHGSTSQYLPQAFDVLKNANNDRSKFIDTIVADSLIEIMLKNDHENIVKLIHAIKNSDKEFLKQEACYLEALIIFSHTPDKYVYEAIETLEYLKEEELIGPNKYQWLRGRLDSFASSIENTLKQ